MKRLILIAGGGLLLASAAHPPHVQSGGSDPAAYPPCTAKRTDRCTQTSERGVRGESRYAAAAPYRHPGSSELDSVVAADARRAAPRPAPAAQPTRVARTSYPRCSSTVTDRCVQGGAVAAPRRTEARRVQLAMRAGERG